MSGAELARQLTERLGTSIDRAAVQKMMMTAPTGKTKPRQVKAAELMAIADITGYAPPTDEPQALIEVPQISLVSAGRLAEAEAVEFYDVDATHIKVAGLDPDGLWIALKVEGDSMDRISPPDSIILVNVRDKRLAPNACYVIADADGSASYKRYRPNPDRFEPVSTNPAHEPMFPDDGNMPAIIGRVRKTILDM